MDGQDQNRWLIASEITTARELLAAKIAGHPKTCQVYWAAMHPESASCRFE